MQASRIICTVWSSTLRLSHQSMKQFHLPNALLFVFLVCQRVSSSPVTISDDGGYSIVIAIHKNVQEEQELITNIEDLFSKASEFLHNATRRQVYFREVTISLPSTWTAKPHYVNILQDNFENAHFKVNEEYDDEPHTEQPEGCGRPGLPVRLSPRYLTNLDVTVNQFGIPERRIVHEWAHYRYGVYDEQVDSDSSNGKPIYRANGQLLPTLCSGKVAESGYFHKPDGGDVCQPTSEEDKTCIFYIEHDYVTARASIMYSTVFPTVDSFCDDSEELKHNAQAPNMHNKQCGGRSTWNVISSHQDFTNIVSSNVNTKPEFRIVRATGENGRTVLLLDISGSMKEKRRIQMLHESATHVVLNKAPENSSIGIVAFGTISRVLKEMTIVTNATRQDLASRMPRLADGGGTGIGRGLMTALEVLRGSDQKGILEGASILLITDGEETDEPKIADVLPSLVSSRVKVHVIAYGNEASVLMEQLSGETGGSLAVYMDKDSAETGTTELVNKIAEAVTLHSDVELEPVKVVAKDLTLSSQEVVVPIILDEELGRNTNFKLSGADLSKVEAKLTTPSREVLDRHSKQYMKYQNTDISFKFKEAETGLYNVTVIAFAPVGHVKLSLDSEPKDPKKQPVRVTAWIGNTEVVYPHRPKIFAIVKKGDLPVLNANVTADIIGPNNKYTVVLKDDGLFADSLKDDGCYTGVVHKIDGNYRYQVAAFVKNTKKSRLKKRRRKTAIISTKRRRRAIHVKSELTTTDVNEFEDEDDLDYATEEEDEPEIIFERTSDAGVFRVSGWAANLGDLVPPAKVTDLAVTEVQDEIVTLSWTSPGDDLALGNASRLDLRGSTDFNAILHRFDEQDIINGSLLNSSLVPAASGEKQTIHLFITDDLRRLPTPENYTEPGGVSDAYYFALRAFDEAGNAADVSNIVYATFLKEGEPTEPLLGPTVSIENKGPKTVTIIGFILGVLFGVAVLLALVYFVMKRMGSYNMVDMSEPA